MNWKKLEDSFMKKNTRDNLKVFVDANTLVSGLLFEGIESKFIDLSYSGSFDIVTCDYVIEQVH